MAACMPNCECKEDFYVAGFLFAGLGVSGIEYRLLLLSVLFLFLESCVLARESEGVSLDL